MRRTVWQLRGSTDTVVECGIDQTESKLPVVTVVLGRDTFLCETYPDEGSALGRATQIRDGLLRGGGWTTCADVAAFGRSST